MTSIEEQISYYEAQLETAEADVKHYKKMIVAYKEKQKKLECDAGPEPVGEKE
jgi:hypothetical protein